MKMMQLSEHTQIENGNIDICEKFISGEVKMHTHDFYEIEFFLTTGGSYILDGITYPIEAGSIFFLSPASFHHCFFTEGSHFYTIMFTLHLADTNLLYRIFSENSHVALKIESAQDITFIQSICNMMIQYRKENRPLFFSAPLLNSLLGRIDCLKTPVKNQLDDPSPIQKTLLYIQANFNSDITLHDLAAIANLSPGYFCDRFHAYTGMTFKKYLSKLRFSYAKKLLKYTNLSITEVAWESGFNDFSHFMYTFKKRFSQTPGEYRKKQLAEK